MCHPEVGRWALHRPTFLMYMKYILLNDKNIDPNRGRDKTKSPTVEALFPFADKFVILCFRSYVIHREKRLAQPGSTVIT